VDIGSQILIRFAQAQSDRENAIREEMVKSVYDFLVLDGIGKVGAAVTAKVGGMAGSVVRTRWGWSGQAKYNAALRQIATESKAAITHMDVQGIVPTQAEAEALITQSGGQILRVDEGHLPGGVSTHTFPHINYTTKGGTKATVQIQKVETVK
jgi:hypothetical protein